MINLVFPAFVMVYLSVSSVFTILVCIVVNYFAVVVQLWLALYFFVLSLLRSVIGHSVVTSCIVACFVVCTVGVFPVVISAFVVCSVVVWAVVTSVVELCSKVVCPVVNYVVLSSVVVCSVVISVVVFVLPSFFRS